MVTTASRRPAFGLPLFATLLVACSSGTGTSSPGGAQPASPGTTEPGGTPNPVTPPPDDRPPLPFEALPPHVYLAKVKGVLTGLAVTDDELKAVTADGKALPGLIDGWMATPQFRARMLRFFQQAFQQTQTELGDYVDLFGAKPNGWQYGRQLLASIEESFARTALALIDEGRPWNEVVTTDRFMLNPPLMVMLAALDARPHDDEGRPVRNAYWLLQKFPQLTLVRTDNPDPVTGAPRPIPFEETIDPASPNFMRFFDPNKYEKAGDKPECKEPQTVTGPGAVNGMLELMWGDRPQACGGTVGVFKPEDFAEASWRMVKIRPPRAGEERTVFWDLPRFRDKNTAELVLATPRVGFMTTLAFFANWPTNDSNASRVATNQALIVGLGRSFDDRGTTVQLSETSVEAMHIEPNTACYGCHQTLDPMRDFFRHSYNLMYFQQLNPKGIPPMGTFAVDDTPPVRGAGIASFAKAMADHPKFAPAWTQKLCQFANSESCDAGDPLFVSIAESFRANGYDFKRLVSELFSSPLVTFAETSRTAEAAGVVMSIARREALCAALSVRLGLADACALANTERNNTARNLALAVAGAAYSRGDEVPLLPHDPNLFFAASTDNLCFHLAGATIDVARGTSRWQSDRAPAAIADFVHTVMGLAPSDPRAAPMRQLLDEHHAEAMKAGASRTDALKSTFIAACTSPFTLSHGL